MTSRQDLVAGFGAAFPAKEGAISKNVEKWLENFNLQAWPYAVTKLITALRDLDLRHALSKIKIPTAIFHGTQDMLCPFVFAELGIFPSEALLLSMHFQKTLRHSDENYNDLCAKGN